ncbi:hypothetical protein MTO96_026256 [Rhipicephalus appendiculatus]
MIRFDKRKITIDLVPIAFDVSQDVPMPPPGHGGPGGPFGFGGAPGQFGGGGFRGRRSDFDMAGYRQEARREAQGPYRGRREAFFGMQDE